MDMDQMLDFLNGVKAANSLLGKNTRSSPPAEIEYVFWDYLLENGVDIDRIADEVLHAEKQTDTLIGVSNRILRQGRSYAYESIGIKGLYATVGANIFFHSIFDADRKFVFILVHHIRFPRVDRIEVVANTHAYMESELMSMKWIRENDACIARCGLQDDHEIIIYQMEYDCLSSCINLGMSNELFRGSRVYLILPMHGAHVLVPAVVVGFYLTKKESHVARSFFGRYLPEYRRDILRFVKSRISEGRISENTFFSLSMF